MMVNADKKMHTQEFPLKCATPLRPLYKELAESVTSNLPVLLRVTELNKVIFETFGERFRIPYSVNASMITVGRPSEVNAPSLYCVGWHSGSQ